MDILACSSHAEMSQERLNINYDKEDKIMNTKSLFAIVIALTSITILPATGIAKTIIPLDQENIFIDLGKCDASVVGSYGCFSYVKSIHISGNSAYAHFVLDVTSAEFQKLPCSASYTPTGRFIIDTNAALYPQVYEQLKLAIQLDAPVRVFVGTGTSGSCSALAIEVNPGATGALTE